MFPKIWQKSTNHGICFGSCTALGLHKIVCISFIILCDEPAIVTKLLDVGLKNNEKHSNATSKINSNNFTFSELWDHWNCVKRQFEQFLCYFM